MLFLLGYKIKKTKLLWSAVCSNNDDDMMLLTMAIVKTLVYIALL